MQHERRQWVQTQLLNQNLPETLYNIQPLHWTVFTPSNFLHPHPLSGDVIKCNLHFGLMDTSNV